MCHVVHLHFCISLELSQSKWQYVGIFSKEFGGRENGRLYTLSGKTEFKLFHRGYVWLAEYPWA